VTTKTHHLLLLMIATLLLAACDLPFLGDEEAKLDAKREAEGRAVGSACRHAGRAIEDCYERSPKASKAAIFNGWRDMDSYMRENNIQVVLPESMETPAKSGAKAEEKAKAAEATPPHAAPAEEKPKAAEAPPPKKPALSKKPESVKQLRHVA